MKSKRANRILRLIPALTLAGVFLLSPRPGCAAEWKAFSIEMNAGAAYVTEKGYGHGLRYGGGIFWQSSGKFGLEVLLEKYDVPVNDGAEGLTPGEMRTNALLFNCHFYLTGRGLLRPYAIIGVGFYFIGYSPDNPVVGAPELDFVDRMALQLGGGLDVRLSSHLAVTGNVRYNMVKTWVESLPRTEPIRDTDPTQQNILHLYALAASLGLKLSF
jgi:opacity protein-like surface antigen